jgi:hypothetical protein
VDEDAIGEPTDVAGTSSTPFYEDVEEPANSQKTLNWIEGLQEAKYREAAVALGLDGDPVAAWELLSGAPEGWDDPAGSELLARLPGWDQLSPEQLEMFDQQLAKSRAKDSVQLPTRYENIAHYRALDSVSRGIKELLRTKKVLDIDVRVATMPTGNVNAKRVIDPFDSMPVIFFEQGLAEFLLNVARAVAWAVPSLGPQELFDDTAVARIRRHVIPLQASSLFVGVLTSYVVKGTPSQSTGGQVPPPPANHFLTVLVHLQMLRFVVGHEMGHVAARYADTDDGESIAPWAEEFDADSFGAAVATELLIEENGTFAVALWATDLAMSCLAILDKAIAFVEFGGNAAWVSESHPDWVSRRTRLRAIAARAENRMVPASLLAVRTMLGMNDAILGKLWEFSLAGLAAARVEGLRPSPLWRPFISRSMTLL